MKNIHVLPTENYKQDYTLQNGEVVEVVRLGQLVKHNQTNEFSINKNPQWAASCDTDVQVPHHIYITSDEEIKEGDWVIFKGEDGRDRLMRIEEYCWTTDERKIYKMAGGGLTGQDMSKKIILTTDQDLIKDGVQSINNEFLEWFVKNPSCESVEVKSWVIL